MRLTRIYVATALAAPGPALVEGAAASHLSRVLRLRPGDALTLFNGDGWDYQARVVAVQAGRIAVELLARAAGLADSPLAVTLVQGVSRGERMDLVLQKATELGVARIVPVLTERSVVRLDGRQAERKLAHWAAIAASACEQCGRSRLPAIDRPLPLDEWLASGAAGGLRLLLAPGAGEALGRVPRGTAQVEILVGPEGGLSDGELAAATAAGFLPRTLGPRILRTETAALAALAVLQAAAGDLG